MSISSTNNSDGLDMNDVAIDTLSSILAGVTHVLITSTGGEIAIGMFY